MNIYRLFDEFEKFKEIIEKRDIVSFFQFCDMKDVADFLEKKLPENVSIVDFDFDFYRVNKYCPGRAIFTIKFGKDNCVELTTWYIGNNPEYTIRGNLDCLIISFNY